MLSDEKSYSERLFMYKKIDSLTDEQSEKAIEEPTKKFNIIYAHEATNKIVEITKGYPFLFNSYAKLCDKTNKDVIELSDVENCIDEFLSSLDERFFKSRYERCAESDKNLFLQW